MAAPAIGARTSQNLSLDAAAIRAGATFVGDSNPLHHDDAIAQRSRYGGLIASGAHTSSLLCGLVSKGFGDEAADGRGQVGVDYKVQFVAPVRVDRPLRMEWTVTSLEPHRAGTLARLTGRIIDVMDNVPVVMGQLTVLYFG